MLLFLSPFPLNLLLEFYTLTFLFPDQSCNTACRNAPSLAALSAERSSEPSKVSAGTAECHILALNDMKTVKALPSLDFCSGGKGRCRRFEAARDE